MRHIEYLIKSSDGLKLHGKGWQPDDSIKAVICLVHGMGEHSGRYHPMAEAFNRAGYAFLAFDLRGHGRSEGRRGHTPGYGALMDDITSILKEARSRYPDLPCFLYGHSLGGNLAIHYALKRKPSIAGVIASAPLLRLAFQPPEWKLFLINVLNRTHVNLGMSSELEEAALSRDFRAVRRYQDDPLTHNRITTALASAMLRAGEWNLQHAAEFPLPLLLMHGNADRVTSVEASIEFAAPLEHRCTLKIWDGFYHELHNEPDKEQVFDYTLAWMGKNL